MATYGVTYGSGRKQPIKFGTTDSRSGNGLSQPMAPLTSIRPNAGLRPINQPGPLDALSRVLQNGQDAFTRIAPPTAGNGLPPVTWGLPPGQSMPAGVGTPGWAPPAPPAGAGTTDLSADPILNQIKALGQRGVQDAATAGTAGAKNDLINFGSVEVPQSLRDLFASETPTNDALLGDLPGNPVLAALNDAGTAQSAAGNPFSVTKQLGQAHEGNQHAIDNTSNLSNLFYSSTHANQLADENNAYLGSQNSALQALAQALSGDNTGLLAALNAAHDQYVNELPNAYGRATAGGGSGGAGGTGDGTGTDPATPPVPPVPPVSGSGANFTPATNPFNPLLGILNGYAPGGRNSLINRYAG